MLDQLGVPVSGLLTGAGVAGLAVSLAAQSTLSNLIAGVTLVLEHPFGIGDYVVLGSYEGTVEDISFRSTRIRTADNVAITIENSKICSEYIQNCDRRTSRLWAFYHRPDLRYAARQDRNALPQAGCAAAGPPGCAAGRRQRNTGQIQRQQH